MGGCLSAQVILAQRELSEGIQASNGQSETVTVSHRSQIMVVESSMTMCRNVL